MTRFLGTVAALGLALTVALPAAAQQAPRTGTTAGGPGAYGRPGELAPGQKPYMARKSPRRVKQRSGTYAGGPAAYGRPGELRPGEAPRRRAPGPRRPAEKSGTDAGGPRIQGIPGQIR